VSARTLLACGILLAVAGRPVAAAPAEVRIDVTRAYVICGHDQIQPNVFGLTAYEGAPLPAKPEGRAILAQAGIACLGFPGAIRWCAPPEQPADGIAGVERWYSSPEAVRLMRDLPLNGDRYMYGRILPGCREIGIEPMVYLLGGPPWILGDQGIPQDSDLYAALVAQYVGLLRRFDPGLRLFHWENEPNAYWFKAGKAGAEYGREFARIARAVKSTSPDVLIGGPVLCWPPAWPPHQEGLPDWYTWDTWTMPFLDAAGDTVDFFDFHLYDSGDRIVPIALEEVTTIAAEMQRRRGKRVPVVISECGIKLTEAEWRDPAAHWRKRTLPWARFLLPMLDQPDKVASVQMHDLSAVAGGWFKFLKGTDLQDQTPTYWLYWLLRHARGTRLVAAVDGGADLTVLATRRTPSLGANQDAEAAVVMLNDAESPRTVRLTFLGAKPGAPVSWERLFVDGRTKQLVRDQGVGSEFIVPARGVAVAFTPVAANAPLQPAMRREEFLGETVMNEFPQVGAEVGVAVTIPAESLQGVREARVRVGTLGNEPGDRIVLIAGGHAYQLNGGTYFQEVPLEDLPRPGRNDLRFKLAQRAGDHRVRVSCASIVIEREVSSRQPRR
jgi:hypothetical protein